MSITVAEGNNDERSKLLAPVGDELGLTNSRSVLSSLVSAADKGQISDLFDPLSCQECKMMTEKKNELRKQTKALMKNALEHRHLEHGLQSSETSSQKGGPQEQPRDILDVFKNIKYTGNLSPLSSRLPDPKEFQNGAPPPMRGVKRLKGDLAKSVCNKIDGCDWYVFHPYTDVTLPEEPSKEGSLK